MDFDTWVVANHGDLVAAANDDDLDATDSLLDLRHCWNASRAATIAALRQLADEEEQGKRAYGTAAMRAVAVTTLRWAADRLEAEHG